jgi:hypothetical protein
VRIRLLNWINLGFAIALFVLAIVNFCSGNIGIGIFDLVAVGLNLFIFLCAVADWWHDSDFILDKFIFTCPNCGQKQIPSFWEWFFVPHIGSKRYLKCQDPACRKRSWMRRK